MYYDDYLDRIQHVNLFAGMKVEDIDGFLMRVEPVIRTYKKNEIVCRPGEAIDSLIIILSGQLKNTKDSSLGLSCTIEYLNPGDCFGIAYAHSNHPLSSTLSVSKNAEILLIKIKKLLHVCKNQRLEYSVVMDNLMDYLVERTVLLSDKLMLLQIKSIRDRLSTYLLHVSGEQEGTIVLPYNQTQLAEYLHVTRTALVNELSKLRKEGAITYQGREIEIMNLEILRPKV